MGRYNPNYDKLRLLKYLGWFVALLLACKFTMGVAFLILIPLMFFYIAQRKDELLFFVILIGVTAMDVNSFFMYRSLSMVIGQKTLMMLAAVFLAAQVFGRKHASIITPVLTLFPYLIFIAITSQQGWAPQISNLKMLLFVMVFLALYGCAVKQMSNRTDVRKIREMILALACFILIGSLLTRPFPAISMMGAEELAKNPDLVSLFKGVSVHSQTLGPWCAMIGTMVFADWVFSVQKKDKLYLTLVLLCPIVIYMTSSRTAMASYLAGMMFAGYFAMTSNSVNRSIRSKIMSLAVFAAVIGGAAALTVPQVREKVFSFVMKYDKTSTKMTSDAVWGSRLHKLEGALENWRQSPIVGNGFQVSEEMKYIRINGIKDMLSAPVEKSTWTYAILEEGGVIGMILFCLFIVISLGLMIKRKAYIGATMLFTFLMVNMGEFGFFSMSATGGFFWCLTFSGLILDYKRLNGIAVRMQQQNLCNQPPPFGQAGQVGWAR